MEKLRCDICGSVFNTSKSLRRHQREKHPPEGKEGSKAWSYLLVALLVLGLGFGAYKLLTSKPRMGPLGSAHLHADFKVYLDGRALDFSPPKYQVRSQFVHVENGDGDVLHTHAAGVTVGDFFKTLGMKFEKGCFTLDTGEQFCDQGEKKLGFYVNGRPNEEYGDHVVKNLEKYLITYGAESEAEIGRQLATITDKASLEQSSE